MKDYQNYEKKFSESDNKKIKKALKVINELIEDYENVHKVYDVSSHTVQATMTKKTIDDLKKIRKTLEE